MIERIYYFILFRLAFRDTDLILKELPKMVDTCLAMDLYNSHGATLGNIYISFV